MIPEMHRSYTITLTSKKPWNELRKLQQSHVFCRLFGIACPKRKLYTKQPFMGRWDQGNVIGCHKLLTINTTIKEACDAFEIEKCHEEQQKAIDLFFDGKDVFISLHALALPTMH